MKTYLGLLLSLPLFLSASPAALAAATPEEAARIVSAFQAYLGSEAGVVKVEIDGDDYTATIDIAPLVAKSAQPNSTFTMTPLVLTLTSKGDGKWDVSQDSPFALNIKADTALTADLKIESYKWDGEFDEKLVTFTEATGEMTNLTLTENVNDPTQGKTDINVSVKNVKIEQSAEANANGGADATATYTLEGLSETFATPGSAGGQYPPMNIVFTAASGTYETAVTGVKSKSVLDIVAFMVAHSSKELIIKDQAILKTMLTAVLPIFENATGTSTFKTIAIQSPVGPIGMDSLTVSVDMNGVVKEGSARESISVAGLSIPAAIVPPWATTLVPKDMTFDFAGSGFDLETPAHMILAALDLAKDPPLPAGFENTLVPTLLPTGSGTITLNPTSVSNDLYSINAEGSMTAGPAALPSGKATVTAKGLDEIMKVIQAAPPEAGLQSGVGMIVAAKGMAKPQADGTLKWDIESNGDGKVLINGLDPMKMQ